MNAAFHRPQLPWADASPWCETNLGAAAERPIFESGHLSAVLGLELRDGREVVLKVRRPEQRLVACNQVHQHLYSAGFPCAEPLAGPAPLGRWTATAEAFVAGGSQLDPGPDSAPRSEEDIPLRIDPFLLWG